MDEKVVWAGCTCFDDKTREYQQIDWLNDEPIVMRGLNDIDADNWFDQDTNIYYQYFYIDKDLFEILANSIEKRPISKVTFDKTTICWLSKFISKKDDRIYELIVDTNNLLYIIKTFKNNNAFFDEYPFEIISYLINGLDASGYQKIEIDIDENNEFSLFIHDRK